ncbi:MAG TPA: hypothetical protein VJA87_01375 [Candidatus Paceibacterota bacterium]
MSRDCSLTTHRIIVQPGKRLRLYRNPEDYRIPAQLEDAPDLGAGTFCAMLTKDNWLVIPGKGGLPLRKILGLRCIEEAWDYEIVVLLLRQPDGSWSKPIDDLE